MKSLVFVLASCHYDPTPNAADAPADTGPPLVHRLFLTDFQANTIYRFPIAEDAPPPAPDLQIGLTGALTPFVLQSGELLVGELGRPQISRFAGALGPSPTELAPITGAGLQANMGKLTQIDNELWVPLANGTANFIDRLRLDAAGTATMVGSVLVANPRGMAFDPVGRHIYVAECCLSPTLHHFTIDELGEVTEGQATFGSLSNPHGVVLTPWGDILVANFGDSSIARFARDTAGKPSFVDAIQSVNGLAQPVDMILTPWEELYVVNNGPKTISRFTFDANHALVARDSFAVPGAINPVWMFLDSR